MINDTEQQDRKIEAGKGNKENTFVLPVCRKILPEDELQSFCFF